MPEPKQTSGEARMPRRFSPMLRVSAFLIVVVLIVGAGTAINATWRAQTRSWQVFFNGELKGVITEEERDLMIAAVDAAVEKAKVDSKLDVGLSSVIEYIKVYRNERDQFEPLLEEILASLEFGLHAVAIVVNGEEVVTLSGAEEAEALLKQLKERFVRPNAIKVEKVEFQESVKIADKYASLDEVADAETAANILLRGSARILQHTVSRGESFWSIANLYRLSASVIQAANPNIRPETLQVGAKLSLKIDEPFVRVTSVEQVKYNEAIPFATTTVKDSSLWTWQSVVRTKGTNGTREVVARVNSVNGKEESREIISTTVVSNPSAQVVAKGTKSAPSASTGSFIWPTTGSVTSPFGRRWGGFHYGVDIGAPSGTAIKAADSGVVSFSGWNGGYGFMVRIEHGGGASTLYAHASKLLVSQNQQVTKGDVIALVGNTGNSYGPHLHFEIRVKDSPVNPLNYFR